MTTSIRISVLSGSGFNNNVPSIRGLKKALAAEEGIIAVLGRSFEFAAVFIMTIYGLKALLIGLDDVPTFAEFFFTVNPPRILAIKILSCSLTHLNDRWMVLPCS